MLQIDPYVAHAPPDTDRAATSPWPGAASVDPPAPLSVT